MNYLKQEYEGQVAQAISLIKSQTIEQLQRILWLSDFFQIADMQRFLILEVLCPLLTPEISLVFYSDVLKKLKNSASTKLHSSSSSNELWEHFRSKIRSYIVYNLPLVIGLQKFQDMVPVSLVEDIVVQYIKNINLQELPPTFRDELASTLINKI